MDLFFLANGIALPPSGQTSQLPMVLSALGLIGIVAVASRRSLQRKWIAFSIPILLLACGIAYGTTRFVHELMLKKKMWDTMHTMARVAEAYGYYQTDAKYGLTADAGRVHFKPAGPGWDVPTVDKLPFVYPLEQLRPLLVPKYIADADFRAVDGWGKPLAFATSAPLPWTKPAFYAIRSGSANGKFDDPILAGGVETPSWDVDIVLSDGQELNYGMWVTSQTWLSPRETIVPFTNRAAALVAKRGPSCEAITTDWYFGDFFYAFVIGPDGRVLCHPAKSEVGTHAAAAILNAHGWAAIQPQPKQDTGTYVMRVTGPDGKTYIVGGTYDLVSN